MSDILPPYTQRMIDLERRIMAAEDKLTEYQKKSIKCGLSYGMGKPKLMHFLGFRKMPANKSHQYGRDVRYEHKVFDDQKQPTKRYRVKNRG